MRHAFPIALLLLAACQAGPPPPVPLASASWDLQATGSEVRFQAVSAVSSSVVWVSGTAGTFGRTVDGGTNWQTGQIAGAEALELRDVHGLDADFAFAMSAGPGEQSRIYRTRDGGMSWDEVFRNTEPSGFFDCFSFWDRERGIAFSDAPDDDFMLMQTADGGDTWTRVPGEVLDDAHPGEGAFASSGTCLVTGDDGAAWFGTGASGIDSRVYRTTDYGMSWNSVVSPIPSSSGSSGIFSLAFVNAETGLSLGGEYTRPDSTFGHVAATSDGGASWAMTGDTGLGGSVFGATFLYGASTPTAVAVAPTGTSWSVDGGQTWTRIDGDSYWAVASSPEGDVWAAGPGGRIARLVTTTAAP